MSRADQFDVPLGLGAKDPNIYPRITELNDIPDVLIQYPTEGQSLRYIAGSGKWVNAYLDGDGAPVPDGGLIGQALIKLSDVDQDIGWGSNSYNWGEINGTITDQADLIDFLTGKSDSNHNHDVDYAIVLHDHDLNYEALLGNPDTDGKILSSTIAGVRSWITPPESGGGGGSALEVQDEGVSLSLETTKLNFVGAGVTVSESVANEMLITIDTGVAESNSEYCPGYIYNYIDSSTWSIVGINASALFRVSRRIKFIDGENTYYGSVSVVDYGSTTVGDTTISMVMEGGDNLTATVSDMCLVSSTTAWSPIASPNSGGIQLNNIATGTIGATRWWVIVGNDGTLLVSNDKCATMTSIVTGTSEHLQDVAFDTANQKFIAVGYNGVFLTSNDGTTWVLDTTTIPGILLGGTNNVYTVNYDSYTFKIAITISDTSLNNGTRTYWSDDTGTSWISYASAGAITGGRNLKAYREYDGDHYYANMDDLYILTSYNDSSSSLYIAGIGPLITSISSYLVGGEDWLLVGYADGSTFIRDSLDNIPSARGNMSLASAVLDFTMSILNNRAIAVGANGMAAYADVVNLRLLNWTFINTGLDSVSDINAVHYDEVDEMHVMVNSIGQIARSVNGIN